MEQVINSERLKARELWFDSQSAVKQATLFSEAINVPIMNVQFEISNNKLDQPQGLSAKMGFEHMATNVIRTHLSIGVAWVTLYFTPLPKILLSLK